MQINGTEEEDRYKQAHSYSQLIFDKDDKNIYWKETTSTNDAGKTRYLDVE